MNWLIPIDNDYYKMSKPVLKIYKMLETNNDINRSSRHHDPPDSSRDSGGSRREGNDKYIINRPQETPLPTNDRILIYPSASLSDEGRLRERMICSIKVFKKNVGTRSDKKYCFIMFLDSCFLALGSFFSHLVSRISSLVSRLSQKKFNLFSQINATYFY